MQKKLWFKAKRYGYGWYPASWQGWAVLAMYLFVLFANATYVNNHELSGSDFFMQFFPSFFIMTVFLMIICRTTGEEYRWRWGKPKEEMVDVYSEQGEPTGKVVSKDLAHEKGFRHVASAVWILNSKHQLLMQQRVSTKKNNPNKWDTSAAGHTDAGESVLRSALREMKEELGVVADAKELIYIGTVFVADLLNQGTYIDNEFDSVYLLKKDLDISALTLQADEVSAVRWVSVSELKERFNAGDTTLASRPAEYKVLFDYLDEHYGTAKN